MSTVLHKLPTRIDSQQDKEQRERRRDRIIGIVAFLILMAAVILMIWAASVSGISPETDSFDYWMVP